MEDIGGRLSGERHDVVRRLGELRADIDGIVEAREGANVDDEHDPEGATIAFERAQLQALADQLTRRLRDLDEALARYAAGSYGRCEVCARPIAGARLAIRPAARTCVACA